MSTRALERRIGSTREGAHVVEMQRRRLLLAIVEVTSEAGLEAATVGRVCQRASVSRRTFYELFEDRHACLLDAFDAEVHALGERMQVAFDGKGRWEERVRGALASLLEGLDAKPQVARFCMIEVPRAGGVVAQRHREVVDALARVIEEGAGEARGKTPPLTAPGIVGGVSSVLQRRLLDSSSDRPSGLMELIGPLMAMVVQPYLGAAAAQRELERPIPPVSAPTKIPSLPSLFKELPIRFTYRTAKVLATIAGSPGASNRRIAESSGISDDGQVSRLLARLSRCELIENSGLGHTKGEPNAWSLTERGVAVYAAIAEQGVP